MKKCADITPDIWAKVLTMEAWLKECAVVAVGDGDS